MYRNQISVSGRNQTHAKLREVTASQPAKLNRPMLHLHHCVSARSFRPLWMLEELQLPYTLHMLPFPPRALARSFLELNPLGTVPLLVQGDVRMTESAAMCQYVAATHAYWQRLQDRPAYQRALAAQHQAALAQGVSPQPSPDIRP